MKKSYFKLNKVILYGFLTGILCFQIFLIIDNPEPLTDHIFYNSKSPINKFNYETIGTVKSITKFPKESIKRKEVIKFLNDYSVKYQYCYDGDLFENSININLNKFSKNKQIQITEVMKNLYELKIKIDQNNPGKSFVLFDETFNINA